MSEDGNPLLSLWAADRPAYGGWCVIPSPFAAEVTASVGFDWVAIDRQHGFMSTEVMASMIQSISLASAAPFVRLAFNEPWAIMKALDCGAYGVIVPLVSTAAEAKQAVDYCRYPPRGIRSYGPLRNAPAIGTTPDRASENVLCFVMIETAEGLANVDAICTVDGVDGIYVGPTDLGLSLGVPHEELAEPIQEIQRACAKHGKVAGFHAGDAEEAQALADKGFRMIGLSSDSDLLARAASGLLAGLRTPRPLDSSNPQTVRTVLWDSL
jgi:4-hydroxy-2-oxoheptanedioate aldolase